MDHSNYREITASNGTLENGLPVILDVCQTLLTLFIQSKIYKIENYENRLFKTRKQKTDFSWRYKRDDKIWMGIMLS